MQQNHLFEYAVIRVVPKVEREEFFNVGVILYCRQHAFLKAMFSLNEEKLRAFCKEIDIIEINKHLQALEQIASGAVDAGPIARLDIASRFRWLTATRSTVVQSSKVHPGLCIEPMAALEKLYKQLVL